jgi:hypothetical protein
MQGRLYRFFADDHDRLERMLEKATENPEQVDLHAYDTFRSGLLKHIGMEEKVLLPAAQHARGGERLPIADRIRLDHGAIAALLVPTPSPTILNALRAILAKHNNLEEQQGGLYEACEELTIDTVDTLVERLKAMPSVPINPMKAPERVLDATRRALVRAGYNLADYEVAEPTSSNQEQK